MPGTRGEKTTSRVTLFYAPVLLTVAADQLSKWFMVSQLPLGQSVPVIPGFFHLTLVYNTGIAFGLFQDSGVLLFTVISLSIVLLILAGPRLAGDDAAAQVSMALILGGALGNWIDRCRVRAVIDFLDFQVWPVFNIADSAITVGVGIYLLKFFREKFQERASNA